MGPKNVSNDFSLARFRYYTEAATKMAASAKEKFDAAVNVIQSLPKNGSFQPSHELMLRFYAFYKQAVEGPCTIPKPGFWDVVKKAKWEAWNKLGDMRKEVAMCSYVEELKLIVEAMPQTQIVTDFVDKLGSFYELVDDKTYGEKFKKNSISLNRGVKSSNHFDNGENVNDFHGSSEENSPSFENGDIDLLQNDDNPNVETEKARNDNINGLISTSGSSDAKDINSPTSLDLQDQEVLMNEDQELLLLKVNQVTSDTDSDTEYCDSSDQLIQTLSGDMELPVNKETERVNAACETELESWVIDPFQAFTKSSTPHEDDKVILPASFPFAFIPHHRFSTDSMLVHVQSQQSMSELENECEFENLTIANQLSTVNGSRLMLDNGRNTVMARGGGEKNTAPRQSQKSYRSQNSGSSNVCKGLDGRHSSGNLQRLPPGKNVEEEDGGTGRPRRITFQDSSDINEQITIALFRLQQNMESVLTRLENLERLKLEAKEKKPMLPFIDLSWRSLLFITVWPLFIHWLTYVAFRRKKRCARSIRVFLDMLTSTSLMQQQVHSKSLSS